MSCATPGNCSAGGDYYAAGNQAFVVTQANGTWGRAEEVPGTAALNTGGGAQVTSVSCTAPGNCSAVGSYSAAGNQVFVVTQTSGTWGTARKVLNAGGLAAVSSVSCAAPGDCSAGGYYNAAGNQVFVVTQTSGTWGTAQEVPGTASLNTGGDAQVISVSCAAAGECSAGGYYNGGGYQAFVVTES